MSLKPCGAGSVKCKFPLVLCISLGRSTSHARRLAHRVAPPGAPQDRRRTQGAVADTAATARAPALTTLEMGCRPPSGARVRHRLIDDEKRSRRALRSPRLPALGSSLFDDMLGSISASKLGPSPLKLAVTRSTLTWSDDDGSIALHRGGVKAARLRVRSRRLVPGARCCAHGGSTMSRSSSFTHSNRRSTSCVSGSWRLP